jgi:hypothetical protein
MFHFYANSVIIMVQVAQVRVAASESSVQIAYLSVNDRVELDIKYADELGRSITFYQCKNFQPFDISHFYFTYFICYTIFHQVISSVKHMEQPL